jgi:hypothetical protein
VVKALLILTAVWVLALALAAIGATRLADTQRCAIEQGSAPVPVECGR